MRTSTLPTISAAVDNVVEIQRSRDLIGPGVLTRLSGNTPEATSTVRGVKPFERRQRTRGGILPKRISRSKRKLREDRPQRSQAIHRFSTRHRMRNTSRQKAIREDVN